MKARTINILLVVAVIALLAAALFANGGAEFAGADAQAEKIIAGVDPTYQPWFEPIWEPPSGEIESLLFAVQAAIGTGFICFYFGYQTGQKKKTGGEQSDGH